MMMMTITVIDQLDLCTLLALWRIRSNPPAYYRLLERLR